MRQTAITIDVPAAEPVVARWREQYDPPAVMGMPAHVTLLWPFVPRCEAVVRELRSLFAARAAFDVEFASTARFPGGVLYLAPEPAAPLRELTEAIFERWPEAPPFEGAYEDIVPHLTVANGHADDVLDAVDAELRAGLPVATRVDEAQLYEFDGGRWGVTDRFALGG